MAATSDDPQGMAHKVSVTKGLEDLIPDLYPEIAVAG